MLYLDDKQIEEATPQMTVKEIRELREPERAEEEPVSILGYPLRVYPEGSLIATPGCGKQDCFSCHRDGCEIRQVDCYCVEAPMGNPFPCTTLNVVENLRQDIGNLCQFVNEDLAFHRAGDGQPVPCCKKCNNPCGYECNRSVQARHEVAKEKMCDVAQTPEPEEVAEPEVIADAEYEEVSEEQMDEISDIEFLRRMVRKENADLEEYIKVDQVEPLPPNLMREKKLRVAALASMLCDLEGEEPEGAEPEKVVTEQPKLPVLKNNDQRKEWLNNYKDWGLWYRDENIDVNYYKYDFSDGSRLVVAEYPQRQCYWSNELKDDHYYHLLEKNKKGYYKKPYDEKYRNSTDSETYLAEFLKNVQKGEKK